MLVTSSGQTLTIKRINRKHLTVSTLITRWPIILILALQAIISLATLHNTAFQDEALYIYAGRQIFNHWMGGPALVDPYASYFSGYPEFYPVIAGVLDMIGGLELARWFSMLCMMGVTAAIYHNTNKLFHRPAAIFAAATYVGIASVLFIGRLATYDALCLLLLSLASCIAYSVSINRNPWWGILIAPLLILAVAAKYAGLLFALPVLGILFFCSLEMQGWWAAIQRMAIVLCALLIGSLLAYVFMDKAVLLGLSITTTNRVALIQRTPLALLMRVLQLGGIVYAIELLGVLLLFFRHKRYRLLALLLFAASLLVPAYHMYKQEFVSLDKHVAFSLFFAMPLVGYTLSWLAGYTRERLSNGRYWLGSLAIVLLIFTLGTQQAGSIYASWADTSGLNYQLHTQLRAGSGRYLVEDIEVARYYSQDVSYAWQWNGISYFYYINAEKLGGDKPRPYTGNDALTRAIHDRYFDIIELSFNYQPAQAHFIAQQLVASKNYDLISKTEFQNSFGTGYYYLWRRAAPGHGNFTSLAAIKPS